MSDVMWRTVLPLFLMISSPLFALTLCFAVFETNGTFSDIYRQQGIGLVYKIWRRQPCSLFSLLVVLGYSCFSIFLMKVLPGKLCPGNPSESGFLPYFKDNGFKQYIVTMMVFCGLQLILKNNDLSVSIVFDHFQEICQTLNVLALILCFVLLYKGIHLPSNDDCKPSGNWIFDYYWGTELYPKIWGIDIKVFTNCRFGMMVWAILVCVYAVKSWEMYGFVDSVFVNSFLQLCYISKFFWWEIGYMRTIDIAVDRAGFYICWGCLVYVPTLYTITGMYLARHPVHLGPFFSVLLLGLGTTFIFLNYSIDWQKKIVRETNGDCLIWNKKPKIIRAVYVGSENEEKHSLLLASGWWGMSRHFNYFSELCAALSWTLPCGFASLLPYSYFIFLFVLLVHRSFRDEKKCALKYKKHWKLYCEQVRYRIIPYVY